MKRTVDSLESYDSSWKVLFSSKEFLKTRNVAGQIVSGSIVLYGYGHDETVIFPSTLWKRVQVTSMGSFVVTILVIFVCHYSGDNTVMIMLCIV